MTHDWPTTTVGEFAPFTYGKGLSKKQRNETGDVPVYGSNGIIGYHDQALTNSPTIIIGRKGTVGAVHYPPVPCWPIDTTFYVTDDDPELLRFKYYALQSLGLEDANSDSAVPGLNREFAHSTRFSVPPMEEQRRIAGVLGCLDDKIELNRRMAETLEQMARALFRSWFVDFEPVRAKQEARWRPGQSLPGLPAHLYDSFPNHLEPSEQGPIPAGWRVAALGDVVETVRGRSYKSAELADSEVALVTLKSFARGGGYREDGLKPYTGAYKPEQVVEPGEVVLACTDVTQAGEVVGRPAIVQPAPEFAALVASLDTLIIRPRDESVMSRAFLYFLMGTPAFTAHALAHATGTTVLHLAKAAVPDFRFAQPPADLIQAFDAAANPALARSQIVRTETRILAAQRDTLLVRLIGQPHLTPTPEG